MTKNIKWVDLETSEKTERKFIGIDENQKTEDVSTRNIVVENKNTNIKTSILSSTLFDAVSAFFGGRRGQILSKEATEKNNRNGKEFFNTTSWKDFESHAKLMAQFMNASDDEIEATLNKMKTAFKAISGEDGQGGVEAGYKMITRLEQALRESGVEDNGSSSGVIPKIRVRHFLDILYDETTDMTYDVGIFIQMITNRNQYRLSKLLFSNDNSVSLGKII